ncbi:MULTISPECIES: DUF5667 domain-containing protein [Micromonospora]|uniref:DUF5667 domain-containing protein n=1 Tax=Micromonospora yangpuensis TaxID=683228 RepID=A0A1C6VD04_9ACTN|nr:DUF5667 domain-containing protein [Micromonospora yangpuensis]GGM12771.1 hypothetical protein GCM10012279_33660 [Micromonospora yangpuensis]SCL63904.1 hypothetical protein GA0070617_5326 [Micromonospora yangpuensis]
MDTDLFLRRRAERFAQLLDEANGGRRHHVRSRVDDQLTTLVGVGRQLAADPPVVEVDPGFRTGLRAMLIATAEREGIGATVIAPAETVPARRQPTAAAPTRMPLLPAVTARRARARLAIFAGIAAGAIAVSGISAASENAVPGDPLYGMKRSTERAQLALASSDLSRGQLFLDFARTRTDEAATMRGDKIGFDRVLDDMDDDTREGLRLLFTTVAQRADPAGLAAVDSFRSGQRRSINGLFHGASRTERERIRQSVALLDTAGKRADAFREAIGCGLPMTAHTDSLGPVPATCR